MSRLQHPNIVAMVEHFKVEKRLLKPATKYAIVMEYCSKGSLRTYLKRLAEQEKVKTVEQRLCWYKQLASAVEYIHSQDIVHRDLKPDNVFIDNDSNLKIGEVGLAKMMHEADEQSFSRYLKTLPDNTAAYMAPEVFENRYEKRSDVFSLGLLMFVICEMPKPDLIPWARHQGKHECLGSLLQKEHPASQEVKRKTAMALLRAKKCLMDEMKLFDDMLVGDYFRRLTSSDVVSRLQQIEREREARKRREEELKRDTDQQPNRQQRQTKCCVII